MEYYLYTDSSTQGWGAHLQELTASGIWSHDQSQLHINVLELQAIWLGLRAFSQRVENARVALMSDNTSAVAYLRNQGGTKSLAMNDLATGICLWSEKRGLTLVPRYLPGHLNVLADHLSQRGQILKTEWSLNQTVADRIFRAWGRPFVDLFALGKNTKLAIYVSPIREETSWKVDSLVQNWDGLYAYAYPPTSLIRACLNKVRTENVQIVLIAPGWPNQEWFPDLLDLAIDFPITLPPVQKLLKQTFSHHFHPHPWNLNLHAWRLSRDSTRREDFLKLLPKGSLYLKDNPQRGFTNLNGKCSESGAMLSKLILSRETVQQLADFLIFLFEEKKLAISSIQGYRSCISKVFLARGIDISHDRDLNMLVRNFAIERPVQHREAPRWDLMVVLRLLMKPPFEPMNMASLADMTRTLAFLLTLASAKRNNEVWAFSADVRFGQDYNAATLSFLPNFLDPSRPETDYAPVTFPALGPSMGEILSQT